MKLKLVLESDQWKTIKMPILSYRHVDFFVQCLYSSPKVEYVQGISVLCLNT